MCWIEIILQAHLTWRLRSRWSVACIRSACHQPEQLASFCLEQVNLEQLYLLRALSQGTSTIVTKSRKYRHPSSGHFFTLVSWSHHPHHHQVTVLQVIIATPTTRGMKVQPAAELLALAAKTGVMGILHLERNLNGPLKSKIHESELSALPHENLAFF